MAKVNNMVEIVAGNPFRILGMPANSTVDNIIEHAMAEQKKNRKKSNFTVDIPHLLPPVEESDVRMKRAIDALMTSESCAKHALTWFTVDSDTDKKALDLVRQNKIKEAVAKLEHGGKASNLHNIMVLYLIQGKLHSAVLVASTLFTKYLDEEMHLLNIGSDLTKPLYQIFLDMLAENAITEYVVYAVSDIEAWSDYIVQNQSQKISEIIDEELEQLRKIPQDSYAERLVAGEQLYKNTIEAIKGLRVLYTTSDRDTSKYCHTADLVANEVLQTAIDFTNNSGEYDAPIRAMAVMKLASEIAVGQLIRARCAHNIKTLQEQIDRLPPASVNEQVRNITNAIKRVSMSDRSIDDAENLVKKTLPLLAFIKKRAGGYFYTKLSTNICAEVLLCINTEMEKLNNDPVYNLEREAGDISLLSDSVKRAMALSNTIGRLGMTYELRNGAYAKNRAYLKNISDKYSIAASNQSITTDDVVIVVIAIIIFFLFVFAFLRIN